VYLAIIYNLQAARSLANNDFIINDSPTSLDIDWSQMTTRCVHLTYENIRSSENRKSTDISVSEGPSQTFKRVNNYFGAINVQIHLKHTQMNYYHLKERKITVQTI